MKKGPLYQRFRAEEFFLTLHCQRCELCRLLLLARQLAAEHVSFELEEELVTGQLLAERGRVRGVELDVERKVVEPSA